MLLLEDRVLAWNPSYIPAFLYIFLLCHNFLEPPAYLDPTRPYFSVVEWLE